MANAKAIVTVTLDLTDIKAAYGELLVITGYGDPERAHLWLRLPEHLRDRVSRVMLGKNLIIDMTRRNEFDEVPVVPDGEIMSLLATLRAYGGASCFF